MRNILFPEICTPIHLPINRPYPTKVFRTTSTVIVPVANSYKFTMGDSVLLIESELLTKALEEEKTSQEMHLRGYNFAGPGTRVVTRLLRGDRPINSLDMGAMVHDIEYMKHSGDDEKIKESDMRLLLKAAELVGKEFYDTFNLSKLSSSSFWPDIANYVWDHTFGYIKDVTAKLFGKGKLYLGQLEPGELPIPEHEAAEYVSLVFYGKKKITDNVFAGFSAKFASMLAGNLTTKEERLLGDYLYSIYVDRVDIIGTATQLTDYDEFYTSKKLLCASIQIRSKKLIKYKLNDERLFSGKYQYLKIIYLHTEEPQMWHFELAADSVVEICQHFEIVSNHEMINSSMHKFSKDQVLAFRNTILPRFLVDCADSQREEFLKLIAQKL